MALDNAKNFVVSTVAVAPSPADSGTSLEVSSGDGSLFPDPSSVGEYNCVVKPATDQPLITNAEIVRVTAVSGDTLTITRQQEGTSARTILVGDSIAQVPTAKFRDDANSHIIGGLDEHEPTFGSPTTLTISGGVITVTQAFHRVDTESAVAKDELDTINGGVDGQVLILRTLNSARDVLVKHGTGNIWLNNARDKYLGSTVDKLTLVYDGTIWTQVSLAQNLFSPSPSYIPATGDLVLTTGLQDIPGCTTTFLPPTDEVVLVFGQWEVYWTADGNTSPYGYFNVDASSTGRPVRMRMALQTGIGSSLHSGTAVISLSGGTSHTIKLQAYKTAAAGTIQVNGGGAVDGTALFVYRLPL